MTTEQTKRRDILEKYWKEFRIATGLSYEPMSDKAYEFFEMAMQEYGEYLFQNTPQTIIENDCRKNAIQEVYKKWGEFDNEFLFIEWLAKEATES